MKQIKKYDTIGYRGSKQLKLYRYTLYINIKIPYVKKQLYYDKLSKPDLYQQKTYRASLMKHKTILQLDYLE